MFSSTMSCQGTLCWRRLAFASLFRAALSASGAYLPWQSWDHEITARAWYCSRQVLLSLQERRSNIAVCSDIGILLFT